MKNAFGVFLGDGTWLKRNLWAWGCINKNLQHWKAKRTRTEKGQNVPRLQDNCKRRICASSDQGEERKEQKKYWKQEWQTAFTNEHQTPSPRLRSGTVRYNVSIPCLIVFLHNGNKRLQIKQIASIYGPIYQNFSKWIILIHISCCIMLKMTERYPQLIYYDKAIKTGHAKERKKLQMCMCVAFFPN